jgi:hypothetical protein
LHRCAAELEDAEAWLVGGEPLHAMQRSKHGMQRMDS